MRSSLAHRGWLLGALVLTAGCGRDQAAQAEAGRVSLAIDALVAADPHEKAAPLEALEATSCSQADICAARRACLDAFQPMIDSAARVREARELLDRRDPALAPKIDARLDETQRLQDRARSLQDSCLAAATAMRQSHHL